MALPGVDISLAFSPDHPLQLLLPSSQSTCPPALSPLLLYMLCPLLALPPVQSMTNTSTISASQSQAGAPFILKGWESQKRVYLHKEPPGQNHWPYPVHLIPARLQGSSLVQSGQAEVLDFKTGIPLPRPGCSPTPGQALWQVPLAEEGSRRCNASRELAAPSSHGDLSCCWCSGAGFRGRALP